MNPKVITPMGEEVPASLSALIEFEEPLPMMPQYTTPIGQPLGYPQMAPMPMQTPMLPVMQYPMALQPQPQYMALQETYAPPSAEPAAAPTISMRVTPKPGYAGLDGHGQQPYEFTTPVTVDAGYDPAQLDDAYA